MTVPQISIRLCSVPIGIRQSPRTARRIDAIGARWARIVLNLPDNACK
jgi:hypothetical protein